MKSLALAVCVVSTGLVLAQERAIPTLNSNIDNGQYILPTIDNPAAKDAQKVCPGYVAKHVRVSSAGLDATLYLNGKACNAYGTDINELVLKVQYQTKDRLNIQIYPANIPASQKSWYQVPQDVLPPVVGGSSVGPGASDLRFSYTSSPFTFTVTRKSTGDILFSSKGYKLVFENQYIELKTSLPSNANIYGAGDIIGANFRINGDNRTIWAADIGDAQGANLYGAHPFYMDHRFHNGKGMAHGVYLRNFHGQDILLRDNSITWRTIGGIVDLSFYAGPSPAAVSESYIQSIGLPALQQYWTYGFHQCRWGYRNVSELEEVVAGYKRFNIPLEAIWTDIDYMNQYRDFTLDDHTFSEQDFTPFLKKLHASNQHYVPIVDSAIYIPNPTNASDAYATYDRGHALNVFMKNPDGTEYIGDVWPGYTVFPDWTAANAQEWWTGEMTRFHELLAFDGIWIDMNEVSSFCVGSCGTGQINQNPVHPPFNLPGEKGSVIYGYPEGFDLTNATEAAAASSGSAAQASSASIANPPSTQTTPYFQIPAVTPGVRNINYPPYAINNAQGNHDLAVHAASPNATHADGSSDYDIHSLWGNSILRATYNALGSVFPGKRPFILGRSTAPGSGRYAAHWGGDNDSVFYYMRKSIQQALNFALFGIPFFGVDTCGFGGNTDLELCSRWMQMSAFFTFYRNHNIITALPQEAFRWQEVIGASKSAMSIRYSILPYIYTLMYKAHAQGSTVMRALLWEFPDDSTLVDNDFQFMLGSAVMVLPVITQGVTTVEGQFPGGSNTAWYDWYTGHRVSGSGSNSTLTVSAPLGHIPVYLRGGNIIPMHIPKLTVEDTIQTPWEILVVLGTDGYAYGDVYIDDGSSVDVQDSIFATMHAGNGKLSIDVSVTGSLNNLKSYNKALTSVTVIGLKSKPTWCKCGGKSASYSYSDGKLVISKLDKLAPSAFAKDYEITWGYGYN